MNEKNKQEEIQTRREFFKKAAKSALPVLGAAILSSVPFAEAAAQFGCGFTCSGGCADGCSTHCGFGCEGGCKGGCGGCRGLCQASCSGTMRL